jgi:hypothetical protein
VTCGLFYLNRASEAIVGAAVAAIGPRLVVAARAAPKTRVVAQSVNCTIFDACLRRALLIRFLSGQTGPYNY